MCWWFRFLWQTKFIFTIFCEDCFTLHENPSLIDLLPGFITQEIKKKRKLFKDYLFIFLNHFYQWLELPRCKAIVVQEFWPDSLSLPFTFRWCLTYHLGSTHPYSITVFMEPFSTSVFKFYFVFLQDALTWIFATTTKICTNHNFIEHHCSISTLWSHLSTVENLLPLSHTREDFLFSTASPSPQFQRHPFSGLIHSAGELLHTP